MENVLQSLPVIYRGTTDAWFNRDLFSEWIHKYFIQAVKTFQEKVKTVPEENIKAILLLDNGPSQPTKEQLCSRDGKVCCMFLPPRTTSLLHPRDQSLIETLKMDYRRLQMDECLAVLEMPEDRIENNREKRTLEMFHKYDIRNAIFNLADAWKMVDTTLHNG